MNRYAGNSGLVERIPETSSYNAMRNTPVHDIVHIEPVHDTHHGSVGGGILDSLPFLGGLFDKKSPDQSLFGGLGGLLSKFTKESLEMEDYLLLGMLYLLYRESKDIEFLLIAGAMLIL